MAISFTTSSNAYRDQDLIYSINASHMKYLREDKTPDEIKCRRTLEEFIRKFISHEHHKKKFAFSRTSEILRKNVKCEYFNALKAAEAWFALSTYAKNLYNQPWRREFFEIKLYSGFYKHQIESQLNEAESILKLMGYERFENRLILKEPVDRDRLCKISLDALKAMCECQILFSIYEELSKYISNCTYADILKYRESYPGSVEQTIQDILYCPPQNFCTDCCADSALRGYSPNFRTNSRENAPSYSHATNGYNLNFRDDFPNQCSNGRSDYVRTAKLIDLDDDGSGFRSARQYRKSNIDNATASEHYPRFSDQFLSDSSNSLFDDKDFRKRDTRTKRDDSWGYVLDRLDKENVESKPNYQPISAQVRNALKSNGVSEALNILKLQPDSERVNNSGDSVVDGRERVLKKPNFIELNKPNVFPRKADRSQTWSCTTCTFINAKSNDVCEMCSKSRKVAEEAPLESGGKHCSYCTLVNKKEAKVCEACERNLENSPTYV